MKKDSKSRPETEDKWELLLISNLSAYLINSHYTRVRRIQIEVVPQLEDISFQLTDSFKVYGDFSKLGIEFEEEDDERN